MTHKLIANSGVPAFQISLPAKSDSILVEVRIPAGYLYAPQGKQEVPHLLEHYLAVELVNSGLESFGRTNPREIILGASIPVADSGQQFTAFIKTLFSNLLQSEVIFEQEKRILRSELLGILYSPAGLSERLALNSLLRPQCPFCTDVADLTEITLLDLQSYYHDHLGAAQLFVSQNVPQAWVNELAQIKLPQNRRMAPKLAVSGANTVKSKLEIGQIYVNLTYPTVSQTAASEEQIAWLTVLDLLTTSKGGLMVEGLNNTYSIEGHLDYYPGVGFMGLEFNVLKGELETSLKVVQTQIQKVIAGNYPQNLLESILACNLATDTASWNSNNGRFTWVAGDLATRDRVIELPEWRSLYQGITKEYISSVVSHNLSEKYLQTVLVGD